MSSSSLIGQSTKRRLLNCKFISGNRFNCAYYGMVGPVVFVGEGFFWVEVDDRCERVPIWDLRYFRIYE